jgi:hypothetical protein
MREHATPEEQRERRARRPAAAPPHPLLELQRTAGNRAVAGMLARQPQAEPAEAPAKGGGYTLELGDLGTIPVIALSWEQRRNEVVITSPTGDYLPRLMQAAAQGRPFPVVVLAAPGVRSTMREVIISSVQTGSGEVVTFTLNFKEIEHEYPGSG